GCKVTLRGERAEEFLMRALWVKDFKLPSYCFDPEGNCSFGIPDYTEFKDMKYDPDIGIFGMDISAVFMRPGYRIKHRRVARRRVPHRHRITAGDGMEFMRARYGVNVLEVR
ncbi:MAG TPA: 50S ribosomal protein L5, partial [Thermoplasmata archaeon]|nr:50S ribosomal protein L5 [Thermoplasmata archaeon]